MTTESTGGAPGATTKSILAKYCKSQFQRTIKPHSMATIPEEILNQTVAEMDFRKKQGRRSKGRARKEKRSDMSEHSYLLPKRGAVRVWMGTGWN